MIASAGARRSKLVMVGGGLLLLLLLAAFSLPAVRSAAEDFLSLFRVKRIQPVAAPPSDFRLPVRPDAFATVTSQEQGGTRTFASVQEAAAAGFALRVPERLPAGLSEAPQVTVKEASRVSFVVDREQAEAALAAAGISGVTLDAQLDGAEFHMSIPALAVLAYGDRLRLVQGRSPEVQGPAGLDYDQLRAQALSVLAVSAPDTAAQLGAIGDWRTTLPVPVRSDTPWRAVTVDGVEGVLVEGGEHASGQTFVLWQKDGALYGLRGAFPAADLLATANSLR
ncbi:MAG: hypothetical protein HY689_03025 [Chloroflexi bacterium]|nr:hypothetical protein [Chloroflexota bacterium]